MLKLIKKMVYKNQYKNFQNFNMFFRSIFLLN